LVSDAEETILSTSNHKIAGVWVEPIMGVAGVVPMPDGYFKRLADLTRKYGGLVVSDEVQTGFGRIGEDFWGFRQHGVKPDIVITAKAMGNGYPLAAVTTSRKIMAAFTHNFFNTYGAGPLQCRLGLEVLNIMKEEKLAENAGKIGGYLIEELKKIQKKNARIGDIRGKGIMIGIECVKDPITK
jgi:alanine-glyoxylate transaminase/(R)-3-amino-2-methylpropionate-pyruvate transaminase